VKGLKTTLTMAIAVGLLAGSAVGVAAQDEESEAPPVAYTTGTTGSPADGVEPTEESVPGGRQMRGLGLIDIPLEFTDARLSGLFTISANGAGQDFADGIANLESRTYRLVNDDGAWAGSGDYIFAIADGSPPLINQESMVLTGEGAYDGLIAYVFVDFANEEPELEAVIVEVERAPFPEPVAVE
jgi:hypothetical protein